MSVVVFATVKAKPGSEDEVAGVYAELAAKVHEEDGCELYAVHTNRNGVFLVEKWASGAALRAHADGAAVKAIRARTADLVEGPTDVVIMKPYPGSPAGKGIL